VVGEVAEMRKILFLLTIICAQICHLSLAAELNAMQHPGVIMEAKPRINAVLVSPKLVKIPVGETVELTLEFSVPANTESFTVELNASPEVDVVETQSLELKGQETRVVPVKVYAKANGRYYLNIQIRMSANGQQQNGVFATILQAGAEVLSPPFEKSRNISQKVVSLPARERVTRD
jgi:hypothetical protein